MSRQLLCLAAAGILLAQGDVSFGSQQIVGDGSSVSCLVAADINNDGFLDVIPAHADSFEDFVWYRNEGGGAISSTASLIDEGDHQSVVVADMNQDGLADVLASSYFEEQSLRWYPGMGAGLFGPAEGIFSSAEYTALDVGDFDGDGLPDVVVAHWFDGLIQWYRNRGNGSIKYASEVSRDEDISWWVEKVIAADLTGDGKDEVLAVSKGPSNKISWYEHLGDESWGTENVIGLPDFSPIISVRVADLNGDAYRDVIYASRSSVMWFKNNGGDGTFADAEYIATVSDSNPLGAESISPGDLDGDGDVDLLVAAYNLISWYENDGEGGFARRGVLAQGSLPRAVDLTNDGNLDILATSPDRQIVWYRNQAPARSADSMTESVSSTITSATSATTTAATFDAEDGGADVGSSSTTSSSTTSSSSADEARAGTRPEGPIISNRPSGNNGKAHSPAAACLALSALLALAAL